MIHKRWDVLTILAFSGFSIIILSLVDFDAMMNTSASAYLFQDNNSYAVLLCDAQPMISGGRVRLEKDRQCHIFGTFTRWQFPLYRSKHHLLVVIPG